MDKQIVHEAKFIERADGMYDLQVTMDKDAYDKICEILAALNITIEELTICFLKALVEGKVRINNDGIEYCVEK